MKPASNFVDQAAPRSDDDETEASSELDSSLKCTIGNMPW